MLTAYENSNAKLSTLADHSAVNELNLSFGLQSHSIYGLINLLLPKGSPFGE